MSLGLARRGHAGCGLALLAALVVLSAAATPAGGGSVQLTHVKIGYVPLEGAGQVMYAKHRAMFRKQGIEAELKPLLDPIQIVAALLSGEVQFAPVTVQFAARLKLEGAPIKIVAAAATFEPKSPGSALVAARGKNIARARDLVGETIAVDPPGNTIAHLAVLEWLERNGIDGGDVKFTNIPFPQMLGPLEQGNVDAAFLPEPWWTLAVEQGAKRVATPFNTVCSQTCQVTFWVAREGVDQNLAARFRNAVQSAARWANQKKNDQASGRILAKYVPIDANVIAKIHRSTFGTRLRVSLAKPWLDLLAKYGQIPPSFKPIDLVK